MNEVFLVGNIVSEIEFNFILNSKKNVAIAIFEIEITKNNKIKVKCYNELADFAYRFLKRQDICLLYGCVRNNIVEALEIEMIQ